MVHNLSDTTYMATFTIFDLFVCLCFRIVTEEKREFIELRRLHLKGNRRQISLELSLNLISIACNSVLFTDRVCSFSCQGQAK